MAYILLAILALAVLASFFAAYMSAQNWPIYQSVLVAFIFVGALVFFYLGARTLATHKAWRELVNSQKQEVASLESQLLPLGGGMSPEGQIVAGEIPELKHRLAMLTSVRGGVYYDVSADSVKEGVVQLTLWTSDVQTMVPYAREEPAPAQPAAADEASALVAHGLVPNMVVFAFQQKPISEGGGYVGEFKVVRAAENSPTVEIAPALSLTEAERKQLEEAVLKGSEIVVDEELLTEAQRQEWKAAERNFDKFLASMSKAKQQFKVRKKGIWTLYTTMPADNAKVFAEMDDAARKALLPPESAAEYAQADRELRDYQIFFHDNHLQRSLIADTIAKTTTKTERTVEATKQAVAEAKYRETEKGNLGADLEKFRFEVGAIAKYEKSLEQLLARVHEKLRATYIENRRAATMLSREQLKAEEEINRRTTASTQAAR